jgi:hypothetical protein
MFPISNLARFPSVRALVSVPTLASLFMACSPSPSGLIIRDSARVQLVNSKNEIQSVLEVGFTKKGLSAFWIPRLAAAANDSLKSCPELQSYLRDSERVASAHITVRNRDVSIKAQTKAPGPVQQCLETVFKNSIVGVDQAQFEVALNIRQVQTP